MDALIGHTGFVGGNLARQMRFDEFYNSKNIEDIRGRSFDLVVCAGMPGTKWLANAEPDADYDTICRLLGALRDTDMARVVLISTVDAIAARDAYGNHRADAEAILLWSQSALWRRKTATVVRLPSLFGPGMKKNALYDLMTRRREAEIAPNAVYQWYPLRRLGDDLQRIHEAGIRTVDLVSEPIAMEEIRARFFPRSVIGPPRDDAPNYNVPCEYPEFWLSRDEIMDEIGLFLAGGELMEMREVYSNRVSSIGWEDGKLAVKWAKGGKTSVYSGVPEQLANEVMNAPSIGTALKMSVEGVYAMTYE